VTHPDHAAFLFNLGSSLIYRYQQTGQAADLRESLNADRQAVAKTPPSHPAYPKRLANLGICLLAWYREQGRAEVLGEALANLRSALARTSDVRIRQAFILPALGTALRQLYELTGDLDALNAAIDAHGAIGAEGSPEPAQYAQHAVNLAGVLLLKYKRTGEVWSLEAAIASLQDARDHGSGDSPAVLTALYSSLSTALQERYDLTREQADLDEAISQGRRAVLDSVTPSARRATRNTLAGALMKQFLGGRNRGPFGHGENVFLEEALAQLRQAAGIASADDPELAATLSNLGNALLLANEANMATAAEASEVFGKAAESQFAPPQIRAEANVAGGRLAAKRGDWDLAVRRLAAAIGLLEQAVPRGLGRGDREHQLKRLRDLASDAAACAWRNGDVEQAAVLFEQGRGVLLAQAMNTSTDLEKLDAEWPDLRIRFDELRDAIDASGSYGFAPIAEVTDWMRLTTAEHRRDLIGQWNALTSQIRGVPGLERFLLPPRTADLVAAAHEGPIALVNASDYGSAAFIVKSGGVEAVALPDLTPATARAMVAELLTITDLEDLKDRERRLSQLLGWLWDTVTEPVMDHIDWSDEPDRFRMWWCPSGLLSFLPLHAAGHHGTRADGRTVMDRAVSSYAPTVRLLMHARRATTQRSPGEAEPTLVIAPGLGGLPGAAREAAMLDRLTTTEVIGGEVATRKTVLSALGRRRRVHFACHAFSDIDNPSFSYLELRDHQTTRLTVADITSLRLGQADLAFLSACSTYQGGSALADESIHLGSAFQLAGYRHVVATLWPTLDSSPSVRIAEAVHRDTAGHAGLAATAIALHRATRRERDRFPHAPSAWAAYVHSGI
jgi:tetratricopeptide (TPR) repeat protein